MKSKTTRRTKFLARRLLVTLLAAMLITRWPVPVAHAATIAVGTNGCTLVNAINNANTDTDTDGASGCVAGSGADTITLPSGNQSLTGTNNNEWGPNGLPAITSDITISGNASGSTITRSSGTFRLFRVRSGASLTLIDVTLSNGSAVGGAGGSTTLSGGGGGGGAGLGGAIFNEGTLTLRGVLLSNSSATGGAGGNGGPVGDAGGGGGGGTDPAAAGTANSGTAGGTGNGRDGTGAATTGTGGTGPGNNCTDGAAGGNGSGGGGGGGNSNGNNTGCIGGNGGTIGGGGGGGGTGHSNNGNGGAGGAGAFGGGGGGGASSGSTGGSGGAAGAGGGAGGAGGASGVNGGGGGGGLGAGGAIFNNGGTVTIQNSTLTQNTATGGTGGTGQVAGSAGSGLGGAVYNRNGTVTVQFSTLANNTASAGGGAVYSFNDTNFFPIVAGRQSSGSTSNSTSHTVNFDTTPNTGDLIIVAVTFDGNPTITWPSGWTAIAGPTSNGTAVTTEIRYRVRQSGDTGSSITLTSTSEESQFRVWRFGANTYAGTPVGGTPATGTSTTPNPPSLTSGFGAVATYWLAHAGVNTDDAFTAFPTNYLQTGNDTSVGDTDGVTQGYAERENSVATEDPGTFTLTDSQAWVANTIAVRGPQTSLTIRASILADTAGGATDCVASGTHAANVGTNNIIEANAGGCAAASFGDAGTLPALASNGGPTQTILISSSANPNAYNKIASGTDNCETAPFNVDQRGITRAAGTTNCEIGAFEIQTGPNAIRLQSFMARSGVSIRQRLREWLEAVFTKN